MKITYAQKKYIRDLEKKHNFPQRFVDHYSKEDASLYIQELLRK